MQRIIQSLPEYFPLFTQIVLWLAAGSVFCLHFIIPKSRSIWLVTITSALIAWLFVLLERFTLPYTYHLPAWQPQSIFSISPNLLVDGYSWSFAVAATTLLLATLLTDIARSTGADWVSWVCGLALTALGLLAIQAGDAVILLYAWAGIDIVEFAIVQAYITQESERRHLLIEIICRLAGILLVLWGGATGFYLIVAVALRIGILPIRLFTYPGLYARRGLATLVAMIPQAANMVLLARSTILGASSNVAGFWFFICVLVGLYASLSWLQAKDENEGLRAWQVGMASLMLASAIRGVPIASLAWGLAALFSGGLLFLYNLRDRRLIFIPILGLWGCGLLPFSPAVEGTRLFGLPFYWLAWFFVFVQAFLLAGYLRHGFRTQSTQSSDRWARLVYPWGLVLLPLVQNIIYFSGWKYEVAQAAGIASLPPLDWIETGAGITTALLAVIVYIFRQRISFVPEWLAGYGRAFFSFEWFYVALAWLYQLISRLVTSVAEVIEGEAGLLWVLLILVLVFTFFVQGGSVP